MVVIGLGERALSGRIQHQALWEFKLIPQAKGK